MATQVTEAAEPIEVATYSERWSARVREAQEREQAAARLGARQKEPAPSAAWPAAETLNRGAEVLDARAKEYETAGGERSAAAVARAWSGVTGREMSEAEAWLFLLLLKAVRLHTAPGVHNDSAMDGAVYFALMGESKGKAATRTEA